MARRRREFLEQFFGVPRHLRGDAGRARRSRSPRAARSGGCRSRPRARRARRSVPRRARATWLRAGRLKAMPSALDDSSWTRRSPSSLSAVCSGSRAVRAWEREVPLRSHHFVRLVRGMWACSDPGCQVGPTTAPGRSAGPLGRLFDPRGALRVRRSSARLPLLLPVRRGLARRLRRRR